MFVNEGMANRSSPKHDEEEAEDEGHNEGEAIDTKQSAWLRRLNRWDGRPARCGAILMKSKDAILIKSNDAIKWSDSN